jgi:hypothetical protein
MNHTETNSTNLEELSNQIATIQIQLTELIHDKEKQIAVKPLGKYHDIYLLIIGFTLTAMVGGFISFIYQRKMYDYQKQAINYENKQKEMTEFYKRVSDIITSRYLYARRLATYIEEKREHSVIDAQKEKYYNSIDEWSKNDAYNRAFIQNSFTDSSVFSSYKEISINFTQLLHPKLRALINNPNDSLLDIQVNKLIHRQDSLNKDFFTACSKFVFPEKHE